MVGALSARDIGSSYLQSLLSCDTQPVEFPPICWYLNRVKTFTHFKFVYFEKKIQHPFIDYVFYSGIICIGS